MLVVRMFANATSVKRTDLIAQVNSFAFFS